MKKSILLSAVLMVAFLVLTFKNTQAQSTALNGKWKVMAEKSDFGGLDRARATPSIIGVELFKDSIAVWRTFEGQEAAKETLIFSAKSVETFPDGNTRRLAAVKRSEDKIPSVIFDTHYEVNGKEWEYHRTETWNLSPDGKELTVLRVTTLPNKTDKVKAVYNRLPN